MEAGCSGAAGLLQHRAALAMKKDAAPGEETASYNATKPATGNFHEGRGNAAWWGDNETGGYFIVTLWYKCLSRLAKVLMAAEAQPHCSLHVSEACPQRYLSLLAARTRDAERELRLARELLAEKRRANRSARSNPNGRRSLSANLGHLGTRRSR